MSELVAVRVSPEELAIINDWRRQQPDPPSKAEAIRQLMRLGIAQLQKDDKKKAKP
jgi:hypothetical protein